MPDDDKTAGASPLVLAVDDEPSVLKLIQMELRDAGIRTLTAETGAEAVQSVLDYRPDLVVLDIMLPDESGLEVMRRLRERSPLPVILLTAKGRDADVVRGLELGADDYLAKPFNPEELAARIRAVLRRAARPAERGPRLVYGDLEIDLERRLVRRDGAVVELTRTEWNLLEHLAANAGKVLLNGEILAAVWGPEYRDDLQYLRVWVSRLRSKLERDREHPQLIRTFPGIGYQLTGPDDPAERESEPAGR